MLLFGYLNRDLFIYFRDWEKMSKSGALDLASGLGGKIKKQEVQSAVQQ